MQRSFIPTEPNQLISMDIIQVPDSVHSISYILLIQDGLTGYITAYPLKTKSKDNIFNAIYAQILNFEVPQHIKMDAEPTLIAACKSIAEKFAIKISSSTPFAHASNYVERGYQTLKHHITTELYANPNLSRSDYIVPIYSAIQTYNDTPIRNNMFSKTEQMFNRKQDNLFPFTNELQPDTISANQTIPQQSKKQQHRKFVQGQIIYTVSNLKRQNESSIFKLRRAGPYKVIKDLLDQNTILAKCILTEKTFYIHKDYIVKNKNNRDIELMICNNWDQDISAMDQTKFPKQRSQAKDPKANALNQRPQTEDSKPQILNQRS